MTQVYNTPVTRVFTNLGQVGVGFQLFFYETGTTTKKSVFADEALTTPLTNPVISDSNGYFPQIFLQGTGDEYKAIMSDDEDTDPPTSPIWTADPIEVDANDINAFGTRPAQHWGTTTNTAVDYQISPTTGLSSYSDDLLFSLEIHITNTGAATLAVEDLDNPGSFLSALDLKKYDGAGAKIDLEAGDLQAAQTYLLRIDTVDAVVFGGIETQPASQTEVDEGTEDQKLVTPLTLATKGFMLKSVQTFTSSGTWNQPTDIRAVIVKHVGGGGGGGRAGGGGTGGTGGSTSFGAHCSATGGVGGTGFNGGSGGGGAGGSGSGGDINITGNGGGCGSDTTTSGSAGIGGGSFFGGGAPAIVGSGGSDVIGANGANGGGGAGGYAFGNDNGAGGGGGGGYSEKFITSGLGASETVTIGGGGTAGGSGQPDAGGVGGAGLMIVYEYI